MERIQFHLNEQRVELDGVAPTTTLLRWLRDTRRATGTKEGCAEGDCGACTVAILEKSLDGQNTFRSACSCLLFVPMIHGQRVFTVEGLKEGDQHHLVQETLASHLGSQCGYCTPGVTMALFEACYRSDFDEPWKIDAGMCGNLCRCTGYRPIRDAAKAVAGRRPRDRFLPLLECPRAPPPPLAYAAGPARWSRPSELEALWDALEAMPDARLIAGATDLALEVTKKRRELPGLISLDALPELGAIQSTSVGFSIGAAVRLSDLEAFARFALPSIERMLRYFGSRQIKNRATIGGNLCTASPIGDLAPALLALDASVVLGRRTQERRLPLSEFFLDYRKTALGPGEILKSIEVPRPPPGARVASYKVSKRRELDISTVAASFFVRLSGDTVADVRLAYGGMAKVPARARETEALLLGERWGEAEVERALEALGRDFSPLSDHRGSSWYRSQLAANLLRGFEAETRDEPAPRLAFGHGATVQVE